MKGVGSIFPATGLTITRNPRNISMIILYSWFYSSWMPKMT
jgi:hypothetical protein